MASGGAEKREDQTAEKAVTNVKNPLQNRWALWYFKNDKANKVWRDNLKEVTSFDTVEDFWAVYNHVKPPGEISVGCDYMLFKDGIEPMWEDERNKMGGRWLLNIEKRKGDDRKEILNNCWMETLMCLIGEMFQDSSDEVCGAVVQIRGKGDKLAIWTANSKRMDDIMKIGNIYKEKLSLHTKDALLVYQSHYDVSSKSGSSSRNICTL